MADGPQWHVCGEVARLPAFGACHSATERSIVPPRRVALAAPRDFARHDAAERVHRSCDGARVEGG
jgi:hypothetical protein